VTFESHDVAVSVAIRRVGGWGRSRYRWLRVSALGLAVLSGVLAGCSQPTASGPPTSDHPDGCDAYNGGGLPVRLVLSASAPPTKTLFLREAVRVETPTGERPQLEDPGHALSPIDSAGFYYGADRLGRAVFRSGSASGTVVVLCHATP
jgi:hypothetical protein